MNKELKDKYYEGVFYDIEINKSYDELVIDIKNYYLKRIKEELIFFKQSDSISAIKKNNLLYSDLKNYIFDENLKKEFQYLEDSKNFNLI